MCVCMTYGVYYCNGCVCVCVCVCVCGGRDVFTAQVLFQERVLLFLSLSLTHSLSNCGEKDMCERWCSTKEREREREM